MVAEDATGFLLPCIGLSWKVAVAGKPSSVSIRGKLHTTSSRRGHRILLRYPEFRGRVPIAVNRLDCATFVLYGLLSY